MLKRHVICLIAVALTFGCRKANQFVPPPPPIVTVAHPVEHPVVDSVEFVGTTEATVTVDLRARVNGYLQRIEFVDGSNVKAGDVLFVIEQLPYQLALDAAKAALQKANASQALAESQYRRMRPLLANGVVTQEELDVQASQVATSKADVASATAAVKKAELDLSYTKVVAPVSGRINRHLVDVGNLVQAEQTPLATIQGIDPIYAYFDVSENELLRFMEMLRKHQLPDPDKNPPALHLGLANEDDYPHEGRLDYRELNINPSTGTAKRRGIFANPKRDLIPGMYVRIQAAVGQPQPRLLVDERAIGTDQRGDYLLVVNDKDVVEYRTVRLGIHADTLRVIEDGIRATDRVVVNGLQRARPGAKVTPEPAEMSAARKETAAGEAKTGPAATNDAKTPEQPKADSKPVSTEGTATPETAPKPATKAPPPATTGSAPTTEPAPQKAADGAKARTENAAPKAGPATPASEKKKAE
jgi:RND family efflux transporter MFP subunit